MSVLFETSLGDLIVDLDVTACPLLSRNFLKLSKSYSYNFCSFFNVSKDFIAQTGDPTETGAGGASVFNLLPRTSKDYSPQKYFSPGNEARKLKHTATGTLSMALANGLAGSQFFFTLAPNLEYLDGKHAPFGSLVEGEDTLAKINEALLDKEGRPLRDIRVRHVIVLDDPFDDPEGLVVPPSSPVPTAAQLASLRVGDDEDLEPTGDAEAQEKLRREREARAQALTLEMVGDLPFADVAPPENVLFVCKLNAVTTSEDLELIFSRFGDILSCEIIKDQKTGDSLQYAFIEFKEKEDAERAYVKMDNVLVDDRRIMVDFSQSVSKLHNQHVFNKTGGRPPPNKKGGNTIVREGGGGGGRDRDSGWNGPGRGGGGGREEMVFDLGETDERERDRRPPPPSRDREYGRERDGGHGRRDDRPRDGGRGGGERRDEKSYHRDDRDRRRDGHRDSHRDSHRERERERERSPPRRSEDHHRRDRDREYRDDRHRDRR